MVWRVRWTASVSPCWSHRQTLRNCCRQRACTGVEGERLGSFPGQVGKQPAGIDAKMSDGLERLEKPLKRLQKGGKRRANGLDLLRGHMASSKGMKRSLLPAAKAARSPHRRGRNSRRTGGRQPHCGYRCAVGAALSQFTQRGGQASVGNRTEMESAKKAAAPHPPLGYHAERRSSNAAAVGQSTTGPKNRQRPEQNNPPRNSLPERAR